jgi:BirA family biotin operon repressor/biotin-[acetyl-CoA-carboxylase] ligase
MEIVRHHFETIGSTNTWAKENAAQLDKTKLTLVTASGQTAGRGRFKRHWESPAGQNIYATYCFFIEKHHAVGNIPQIMAISAAEVLSDYQFDPQLKWPNDVLLTKKKAVGILCETTPLSDQLCMILGIGMNVNMTQEILDAIDQPAASMSSVSGKQWNVEEVLEALTKKFVRNLEAFFEEGFLPFYKRYTDFMKLDSTAKIRFHDNRAVWEGTIESIGTDGSLNMKLQDGTIRKFVCGEILF